MWEEHKNDPLALAARATFLFFPYCSEEKIGKEQNYQHTVSCLFALI
jgi:hypothetical protein